MIKFHVALAALSLTATGASAAATVDVDNLLVPAPPASPLGSGVLASDFKSAFLSFSGPALQTWTVGTTGRLAQIDLFGGAYAAYSPDGGTFYPKAAPDFDVTLTILGGGNGLLPGDQVLGSVTRSAAEVVRDGVTSFDLLGLDIFASAGTVLALQMDVEACPAYCSRGWYNTSAFDGIGDTYGYAGGREFARVNGVLYEQFGDMNFRTWTATPEPAGWALMILGFLSSGVALRRSRRPSASGLV
jgi:hypothetical protein